MTTRLALAAAILLAACKKDDPDTPSPPEEPERIWECTLDGQDQPPWADEIGCDADFAKLASFPLDASIPGARSSKTVLDRLDGDRLYFTNSQLYPIHYEFASAHLSGNGRPMVPDLGTFNLTEYYSPDRRFVLGAITYYEGPGVWAYEIAPYDTASPELVELAFDAIRDHAFFGRELHFHPSSLAVEAVARDLPDDIPIVTTDELFAGIDYQPLNTGTTMGLLTFRTAKEVDGTYTNFREVVVLDAVPNDISIVAGIVTGAFQTPLSHINVLSQNRGTPNMGLRNAWKDPALRKLEGKWVELTVGPFDWQIREVTPEEAEAWWEANKPEPLETIPMDLTVTAITDAEDVLDLDHLSLAAALDKAIPAFGGKASHYGGLVRIGPDVPVHGAFVIPVWYYDRFMDDNGFWPRVDAMLADPLFAANPDHRMNTLRTLQADMLAAPLDPAFEQAVREKMLTDFPGVRMRFRSSTTAEDLGDFTGAGLYTSKAGSADDPEEPFQDAIKTVWASLWNPRAFDEREYYSIQHRLIGMAVLVHPSFPDEEANGVAITNNIFDQAGLEPAFYVNAQIEDFSVVLPEDPRITADQFLYYYHLPGRPIVYIGRSNLVPVNRHVLTNAQVYELGRALDAIHRFFAPVYGGGAFYAMDTEFKFDDMGSGGEPTLWMKQARPYPGWQR